MQAISLFIFISRDEKENTERERERERERENQSASAFAIDTKEVKGIVLSVLPSKAPPFGQPQERR